MEFEKWWDKEGKWMNDAKCSAYIVAGAAWHVASHEYDEPERNEMNDKDVINALILCRSMMKCMEQFCKQLKPIFGEGVDCNDCIRVYSGRNPGEEPPCKECLGLSFLNRKRQEPKIFRGSKGRDDGTFEYYLMVGEQRFDFGSQGERDLFHARLLMGR